MSTEEFSGRSISEIQDEFFAGDLPKRPEGRYLYYTYGLSAPAGTVVLFQYRGHVVASAVFTGSERFSEPNEDGYGGALHFDTSTVQTFDPVDAGTLGRFWPGFPGFNQAKQSLDPQRYAAFAAELKNVENQSA